MRFVLLGDHPDCFPLLDAIADASDHQLVAVVTEESSPPAASVPQHVERIADWRHLLTVPDVDGAIVATADSDLLTAARQLASHGVSLVIFPDRRQDTAFAYELALVLDERPVTILPMFRHLTVGSFAGMQGLVASGIGGATEAILIERTLPTNSHRHRLSRDQVEAQLFHDVALLRWLYGEYTRLTALFTGETEAGLLSATVTLAGDNVPEATWTIRGADGAASFLLEAAFTEGTVMLREEEAGQFRLESSGDLDVTPVSEPAETTGEVQLALVTHALSDTGDSIADWSDAVRTFDLVDAVQRSLRRRRTIDLHFESMSERSQFKTQMTALGCGIISLTTFGMILLLIVGAVFDPRGIEQQRAESAGFILSADDFETGTAELNLRGEERVQQILRETGQTSAAVIVERLPDAPDGRLAERRAERVRAELAGAGLQHADERVIVRELAGGMFQLVMTVAWVILFLPLFAFLAMQGLILLTRPPRDEHATATE
ncbi:hypothetical protein Mal4_24160 [Maioricimonas rarisocia]|uniref:Uncharacterized protein n=1 Tax=Maioricimonas rarisocia TaxID=2528026 RepID=A0A517Z6K3_9PLAN|nr:hypothetical protein [Maioricimonas rarisocia]QDU38095.1 hypothetical protein Mal4_24160 [Maioricimonas rarisocia]